MNDRFKFRGKRLDNNEWYYGSYLYLHNASKFDWTGKETKTNEDVHFIIDENDINYAVNPETVGQCTGLKDNTKWNDLSLKEKEYFYNQVNSEDGETIKYQNIEDVKHLWNGKLIYEEDIVKFTTEHRSRDYCSTYTIEHIGKVTIDKYNHSCVESEDSIYHVDRAITGEVIGNIYENPELLR